MNYNPRNQPPSQRMTTEQQHIAALLAPTDGLSYQFDSYLLEDLKSYHLAVMDFFRTYCQENPPRKDIVNLARIRLHQDLTALYDPVSKRIYLLFYIYIYLFFIIIYLLYVFIFIFYL